MIESYHLYLIFLIRISHAWIGLYKTSDKNSRLGWTWLDGTTYNMTALNKWYHDDPNSDSGCGRIKKDGIWKDKICSELYHFVCVKCNINMNLTISYSIPP